MCLMGLSFFRYFIDHMCLKTTKMVNWEKSVQRLQCDDFFWCVGISDKKGKGREVKLAQLVQLFSTTWIV